MKCVYIFDQVVYFKNIELTYPHTLKEGKTTYVGRFKGNRIKYQQIKVP
jgi:hypothetical protein